MVIDPWGTIIAQASSKNANSYFLCDIDLNIVDTVRQSMPIQLHEKPQLYSFKRKSLL